MDVLRRRGWLLGLAALGALVGLLGFVDRCGTWERTRPQVLTAGRGRGPLRAGAAVVALTPRYPVTVAGYPPLRPTARTAAAPLAARATALEVGGQLVAVVTLDALLVTARMQLEAQRGFPGRLWLVATHTHSGPGGHDARLAAEVAALGRFDEGDEAALVEAARAAADQARAALAPARLELAQQELPGLNVARSGAAVDRRLTALRFAGERPIAQWLLFSAHPTLVAPSQAELDPDWPGRLSALAEAQGGPVTLVLQGAGGNASVDRAAASTPDAFAHLLLAAANAVRGAPVEGPVALGWAEVGFGLPHPDGSRLLGGWLRTPVENALCAGAEHDALVAVLRLGPAALLFSTLEPSAEAGAILEQRARVGRAVGLANGYHGYLEPADVTRAVTGEGKRQLFGPEFMELVGDAAQLAGELSGL
jgi:hypothetical protein